MGKERNGSKRGRLGLRVALLAAPMLLFAARSDAGIAQIDRVPSQQSDTFARGLISHADDSASAEMYLPDPAQNSAAAERETTIPEITIPQLPGEAATSAPSAKEGVNAIPLPPAVQSGLAGLVALSMAGGLRRLRRVLR